MAASTVWKSAVLSMTLLLVAGPAAALADDAGQDRPSQAQRERGGGENRNKNADQKGDEKNSKDRDSNESREQRQARIQEQLYRQFVDGLELTKEQDGRVRKIVEEAAKERKAWHDQHKDELREIRRKIADARRSGDKEAGKAAHQELRALMEDAPHQSGVPDALRELLTSEQVDQLLANVKAMREQAKERRQQRDDDAAEKKDQSNKADGDS